MNVSQLATELVDRVPFVTTRWAPSLAFVLRVQQEMLSMASALQSETLARRTTSVKKMSNVSLGTAFALLLSTSTISMEIVARVHATDSTVDSTLSVHQQILLSACVKKASVVTH